MVLDDELNDELNIVEHDVSPNMWHKRLVGKTGVHVLTKKSLILFAKGKDVNPCDICLLGKQSVNSTPHDTKNSSYGWVFFYTKFNSCQLEIT